MSKIVEFIDYCHEELKTSEVAKQYLKSRGLTNSIIVKFKLGYCPHEPKYVHMRRFYDRIIFPFWDHQGNLVGWTGRTLINAPAKYLNIRETPTFKKNRLLYAYNFAKDEIIRTGTAVLVEGQMDAIILHQVGIINTVASSGTSSFKMAAASLLARYAERVYVAFDGDTAGTKATVSAEVHLKKVGISDIITVKLPDGEDPASYIIKNGCQKFLELALSVPRTPKKVT